MTAFSTPALSEKNYSHELSILVPMDQERLLSEVLDSSKLKSENGEINRSVRIHVSANATLRFEQLQNLDDNIGFIQQIFCTIDENAKVLFSFVNQGSLKGKTSVEVHFQKPGSSLEMRSLQTSNNDQSLEFSPQIFHDAPHCSSKVHHFTVLDGHSKGVFNGRVVVGANGQKTQAVQNNRNLLLSKKAKIETLPQLEIAIDDLSCSHGAAVTTLDEDQIYYLTSRGISQAVAEKMVINSFIHPVISHILSPEIQNHIELGKTGLEKNGDLDELD